MHGCQHGCATQLHGCQHRYAAHCMVVITAIQHITWLSARICSTLHGCHHGRTVNTAGIQQCKVLATKYVKSTRWEENNAHNVSMEKPMKFVSTWKTIQHPVFLSAGEFQQCMTVSRESSTMHDCQYENRTSNRQGNPLPSLPKHHECECVNTDSHEQTVQIYLIALHKRSLIQKSKENVQAHSYPLVFTATSSKIILCI